VTFAEHEASSTWVMLTRDFSASKKDVEPCVRWSVKRYDRGVKLQFSPAITAKRGSTA
jgi:hypothetical protein